MKANKKKILYQRLKSIPFWLGILGAVKLILEYNGITIDDAQINLAANAISSLTVFVGILIGYEVPPSEDAPGE